MRSTDHRHLRSFVLQPTLFVFPPRRPGEAPNQSTAVLWIPNAPELLSLGTPQVETLARHVPSIRCPLSTPGMLFQTSREPYNNSNIGYLDVVDRFGKGRRRSVWVGRCKVDMENFPGRIWSNGSVCARLVITKWSLIYINIWVPPHTLCPY